MVYLAKKHYIFYGVYNGEIPWKRKIKKESISL